MNINMMENNSNTKTLEIKSDVIDDKIRNVYFFILYGFSYFSEQIFFRQITEIESLEDYKFGAYYYMIGKINIFLSLVFICIVIFKEHIRVRVLSFTSKEISFNYFNMTTILIFIKFIELILMFKFNNQSSPVTSILIGYFIVIIFTIMSLGLSLFLSLIIDLIRLIFKWNFRSIEKKLKYSNLYIENLPDAIKLIMSNLLNRDN